MSVLWAVLGVVVLGLAAVDAVLTTLGAGERTGPLTGLLTRGLWRLLRRGRGRHRGVLRYAGPLVLLLVLLTWVVLLWAGWALVLLAGEPAVQQSTTGAPASLGEVVYFAGFTVFTLGVGDFVPTTDLWRVVTALASFSGLFLVTLAITYLLNVLTAVVARRALGQQVSAMGSTPVAVLLSGWDGRTFTGTYLEQLNSLTGPLSQAIEQQLAYPVAAFFHTTRAEAALPRALAALDDAMLLMEQAVAPDARPSDLPQSLRALADRLVATSVLDDLGGRTPSPPPPPDLASLRQAGVPLRPELEVHAAIEAAGDRRRRLLAFVEGSAGQWPTD